MSDHGGSPDLRIGDAEREAALKALGEHMSVGRLDVDEYGERAARVTAAKTRSDIVQLFTDLPQPHPVLDQPPDAEGRDRTGGRSGGQTAVARRGSRPSAAQQRREALIPLSAILVVVLFFSVPGLHHWPIFLFPAAVAVIIGSFSRPH